MTKLKIFALSNWQKKLMVRNFYNSQSFPACFKDQLIQEEEPYSKNQHISIISAVQPLQDKNDTEHITLLHFKSLACPQ